MLLFTAETVRKGKGEKKRNNNNKKFGVFLLLLFDIAINSEYLVAFFWLKFAKSKENNTSGGQT